MTAVVLTLLALAFVTSAATGIIGCRQFTTRTEQDKRNHACAPEILHVHDHLTADLMEDLYRLKRASKDKKERA